MGTRLPQLARFGDECGGRVLHGIALQAGLQTLDELVAISIRWRLGQQAGGSG